MLSLNPHRLFIAVIKYLQLIIGRTKRKRLLLGGFISLFLMVTAPETLLSQSHASNWFKWGLKAQSIDDKYNSAMPLLIFERSDEDIPIRQSEVTKNSNNASEKNANKIQTVKKVWNDSNNHDMDIEETYQEGVLALQNGDWRQAVLAFEKVILLDPDYKDTQNRIADAQFNLTKSNLSQMPSDERKSPNTIRMIGGTISGLVLLIFGMLIFSPATRARLYLLQGKYHKAAYIYERLLSKDPARVKLYPLLANIYLIEHRQDERALNVYERALRLHPNIQNKEEINSILANHYLAEGRIDANAIQILERELNAKMKKLTSAANRK
ncbi:MAG: tetratricopeptide repeat protein [bacterium]